MATCDLIIRNGLVVDGTGAPAKHADVAIKDGKILAVGESLDFSAQKTIDASGRLVTPGWVDIHTHFDGQILWDPYVTPASNNGVTSVVFGNCGIGFAPVAPDQREFLIKLMEGVGKWVATDLIHVMTICLFVLTRPTTRGYSWCCLA